MAIPKNHLGIKGVDECQCGRRATLMHCTKCGSSRVYARQNRAHTHMNGEVKFVETQFRCQTCGHLFIEAEREFCDAPPVSEALARQKALAMRTTEGVAEAIKQTLPPGAIEELIDKTTPKPQDGSLEAYREFKRLETKIRGGYADWCHELKMQGKTPDITEREFVDNWLLDTGKQRVEEPKEG